VARPTVAAVVEVINVLRSIFWFTSLVVRNMRYGSAIYTEGHAGNAGGNRTAHKGYQATSSVVSNCLIRELGRTVLKNSFLKVSNDWWLASCVTKSSRPAEWVGSGRIAFTVNTRPRTRLRPATRNRQLSRLRHAVVNHLLGRI
jgi:hypothetical protein